LAGDGLTLEESAGNHAKHPAFMIAKAEMLRAAYFRWIVAVAR